MRPTELEERLPGWNSLVGDILEAAVRQRADDNFVEKGGAQVLLRPDGIYGEFYGVIFQVPVRYHFRVRKLRAAGDVVDSAWGVVVGLAGCVVYGFFMERFTADVETGPDDLFKFLCRYPELLSFVFLEVGDIGGVFHFVEKLVQIIEVDVSIIVLRPIGDKQIGGAVTDGPDIGPVQFPAGLVQRFDPDGRVRIWTGETGHIILFKE